MIPGFDTIGTIISNMSAQTSRLSLMSEGPRFYHLVSTSTCLNSVHSSNSNHKVDQHKH